MFCKYSKLVNFCVIILTNQAFYLLFLLNRAQGILKPPVDVFNQNPNPPPPVSSPLPPKLPDTLDELLAEYNLQVTILYEDILLGV